MLIRNIGSKDNAAVAMIPKMAFVELGAPLKNTVYDDPRTGSPEALAFNAYITNAVEIRDDETVINFGTHPSSNYAVPTSDHFLPLLYVLGASDGKKVTVFNNHIELDSMAMTSYLIEHD